MAFEEIGAPQLGCFAVLARRDSYPAPESATELDIKAGSPAPVDLAAAAGTTDDDDTSDDSSISSATGLIYDTAAVSDSAGSTSTSGLIVDTAVIISGTVTTSLPLASSPVSTSSGNSVKGGGAETFTLPNPSGTSAGATSTNGAISKVFTIGKAVVIASILALPLTLLW